MPNRLIIRIRSISRRITDKNPIIRLLPHSRHRILISHSLHRIVILRHIQPTPRRLTKTRLTRINRHKLKRRRSIHPHSSLLTKPRTNSRPNRMLIKRPRQLPVTSLRNRPTPRIKVSPFRIIQISKRPTFILLTQNPGCTRDRLARPPVLAPQPTQHATRPFVKLRGTPPKRCTQSVVPSSNKDSPKENIT